MNGLKLKDPAFLAGPVSTSFPRPLDEFEAYSGGADLDTLNLGTDWGAAYVSRGTDFPPTDDFESYADGTDLDGQTGGTPWNGAYVSREHVRPFDDFETYADTANLDGLNDGTYWAAAYVSR